MSITIDAPVLITGINGFIARHLAERLLSQGISVRGTARRPDAAAGLAARGVEVKTADLLDAAAWPDAVAGCRVVVHAAAWTGGPGISDTLAWRSNVEGTINVLAAAAGAGIAHFLYISSVAVYGLNSSPLIDETAATPPVGQLYPDSKIAAEARVRSSSLPYTIIRPASTYGPHGDAWTLGPIKQIRRGRLVLLGEDGGLVTPGYIENVVDGLWLALTQPAALGETFNLCDARAVTYREFYLAYAAMLGRKSLPTVPGWTATFARNSLWNKLRRLLRKPAVGPWSLHFRRNPSQFAISHAQALLGYTPAVDFQEGMRRTEAWLRMNGYLS